MMHKYFQENELTIVDMACGNSHALLRCVNKDGKPFVYGICKTDNLQYIGGSEVCTSVFMDIVHKIDVDASRVEDITCTRKGSFILMAADK